MDMEEFERIAEEEFANLPDGFRSRIDNVSVVVEDLPTDYHLSRVAGATRHGLLGLYSGIPLTRRNTGYGMAPVIPDTITLFKRNIEAFAGGTEHVRGKIREVLIHEIGHYFGMTEEQVRAAGY
jgi:predicted Zn-dependent protease with MMP-like domain